MNSRYQSLPEFVYGLARYGRTFAALITPIINMACHGNVEFKGIKVVRGICYGHNVLINPVRDLGRAELSTM
jgi:hypothetical protein